MCVHISKLSFLIVEFYQINIHKHREWKYLVTHNDRSDMINWSIY